MDLIVVATLTRAHGLDGELLVRPETDAPEATYAVGARFTVDDPPLGLPPELTLATARPHGRGWALGFEEIDNRELAERYAGRRLLVPRAQLPDLGENEFFLHQLVGLEVRDASDGPVGRVAAVYDAAGVPLLAVMAGGRERLVPFGREFVTSVDPEAGVVWIDPPNGLLDL